MANSALGTPKRRKSIVQTLVSSLEMKFDEESETNRLEAEIAEEEKPEPESRLSRFRRSGALILHSKQVLMVIVLLNVIDCLLVTGELILDIHYIKDILEESDLESQRFVDQMQARYPDHLSGHSIDQLRNFHQVVYQAQCYWTDDLADICGTSNQLRRLLEIKEAEFTDAQDEELTRARAKEAHAHSQWVDVAHGLHKASIAILGVLFLENLFKIVFMGKRFFQHKIEVFDAFVVCASFIVDLVFLKGLIIYRIQDGVLILSFLLPWRVIRVVNSLVVAVIDHEHFRLKMMYKEKKKLANEMEQEQDTTRLLKERLRQIEIFLEKEGMPRWKFAHYTQFDEKRSSVASMVSLAVKGVVGGVFSCYPQLEKINEIHDFDDENRINNNMMNGDYLDHNMLAKELYKLKHQHSQPPTGNLRHSTGRVKSQYKATDDSIDTETHSIASRPSTEHISTATERITEHTDGLVYTDDNTTDPIQRNDKHVHMLADRTDGRVSKLEKSHSSRSLNGYINGAYMASDPWRKQHDVRLEKQKPSDVEDGHSSNHVGVSNDVSCKTISAKSGGAGEHGIGHCGPNNTPVNDEVAEPRSGNFNKQELIHQDIITPHGNNTANSDTNSKTADVKGFNLGTNDESVNKHDGIPRCSVTNKHTCVDESDESVDYNTRL